MSRKILIISHDKVGASMAGPGIRYHQMALNLSKDNDVTLAVFNPVYIEALEENPPYKAIDIHVAKFQDTFKKFEVIIALWLSDDMIRFAKENNIVTIFDLYAPVPVEDLVQRVYGGKTDEISDYDYTQMLSNYSHFINNGDFLLTSNSQQNDFWLGYAFAGTKTSPSKQLQRPVESYFGIVPMGIKLDELIGIEGKEDLLSKRVPEILPEDFVIVWTGGIWDWFDARTPIEAIGRLVQKHQATNIKLVFLGTKHPNDDVPAMKETEIARVLAAESGLLNKNIFFLDGWLPYTERLQYLKRGDVALYAHKPSIEARFSHRTRVLDHILMKLPTIATKDDFLSDFIASHTLGLTTKPYDAEDMANAILTLSSDNTLRQQLIDNIRSIQEDFTWNTVLNPLRAFIQSEHCTPSEYVERTTQKTGYQSTRLLKKITPQPIKNFIKKVLV